MLTKGDPSRDVKLKVEPKQSYSAADVWIDYVRPWCTHVIGVTFFVLSVYQSISFFVKYSQVPMTTIVTLEKIDVQHMPWITVCPNPGVSFTQLEEYFATRSVVANPGADPAMLIPRRYTLQGLTPDELEGVLGQTNDTINDLLRNVSLPLWTLMRDCAVRVSGSAARSCSMLPASAVLGSTSLTVNVDSTAPMIRATTPAGTGVWETNFVMESIPSHFYFRLCSTFQPNFALKPGKTDELEMKFSLAMDRHYAVTNTNARRTITEGRGIPSYVIYLRQPNSIIDSYLSLSDEPAFYELRLGQTAEFALTIDKYIFIQSPTFDCSTEPLIETQSSECRRNCFEARFMKPVCRIPGYRNRTIFPGFTANGQEPEVCRTGVHYRDLRDRLDWSKAGQKIYDDCTALCPKPCVRLQYEGKDVTNAEAAAASVMTNFTNAWNDFRRRDSVLKFVVKSPYVKVIEQQYAFGMHQLIGELGGTWGLFLGLSILSVLNFFEEIFLILLRKRNAKKY